MALLEEDAVSGAELLMRVRVVRRALLHGEVEFAYTLVASIEHALAYDLDTLPILLDDQTVESATSSPITGVQTAEKALAMVVKASRTPKPGPPRFAFIVDGEVEGPTTADLYTSVPNERDRVLAWLTSGVPEVGWIIGAVTKRFASTRR